MKKITFKFDFDFCQLEELPNSEQHLVKLAIEATNNSYSKYSHFSVGAAVLLNDGTEVIGANQENAAYPSGLCAERTAIFSAQAQFPSMPIKCLAIAAKNINGVLMSEPVTPCGACRQVILEIEDRYNQPTKILLYGTKGIYIINSVKDLLPLSFINDSMYQ
jgi:cytidine deaminase